mgnify:CR=1 FL=1|jgi:hypothetical protein
MTEIPAYTQTNESITVVIAGTPHTIKSDQDNWGDAREAIFHEKWELLLELIAPVVILSKWAKGLFRVEDNLVFYDDEVIPQELNVRILQMAKAGDDPAFLFQFWERLQRNPSYRSVEQLYPFLEHQGIPIVEGGFFLAYKGVTEDYMDCHTRKISNKPGEVLEMNRNRISDDPNQGCHYGYHVGALRYASSFGPRTVIVKVDPEHVVCIPYDSSHQKMRVCKYEVIGYHGVGHLPDTTYTEPSYPEAKKEEEVKATPAVAVDEESGQFALHFPCEPKSMNRDQARTAASTLNIAGRGKMSADELRGAIEVELLGRTYTVEKKGEEEKKAEVVVEEEILPITTVAELILDWGDFHKLSDEALESQNLGDLRKYAGKVCNIVGASKIPGGKSALLKRVREVRADLGVS